MPKKKEIRSPEPDLVLGIDPGTAIMGYGLVREVNDPASDRDYELVEYGVITTPSNIPQARRLLTIYSKLNELLDRYAPSEIVVEELFFNKNTTTAIVVGQARGVALLAAATHNLPVREYTPLQVKQSLSGYGRATKEQIQEMVRLMLDLEEIPQPDDAADALAVAICHLRSRRALQRIEESSQY